MKFEIQSELINLQHHLFLTLTLPNQKYVPLFLFCVHIKQFQSWKVAVAWKNIFIPLNHSVCPLIHLSCRERGRKSYSFYCFWISLCCGWLNNIFKHIEYQQPTEVGECHMLNVLLFIRGKCGQVIESKYCRFCRSIENWSILHLMETHGDS